MKNSIKFLFLESIGNTNEFVYIKDNTFAKVYDVNFDIKDNYVKIDFSTTYNKKFSFVTSLLQFKRWLNSCPKQKHSNVFFNYLTDFFNNSKQFDGDFVNEIIDDTNEVIPDQDIPSNATGRIVGTDNTMDLEKVFKKSMPKSIRNYSGNLGLGTVVW